MNSVKYLAKYFCTRVGLLYIAVLLATSGCAVTNSADAVKPAAVGGSDSIIAQDFVNIMVQIDELSPLSTVLRFGLEQNNPSESDSRSIKTNNTFGKALRVAAANSGYAM